MSIQGLVLVAEPYYNEAGFDRQQGSAEGARNSVMYNESAFLLCCKTAVHTMRRPSPGFVDLVKVGATLASPLRLKLGCLPCQPRLLLDALGSFGAVKVTRLSMYGLELR